jgi:hypothetical protein
MCFVVSLIFATVWVIIGYFVIFASSKAEGNVRKFGQGLAIWIFVIATSILLVGAYVTLAGLCPLDRMIQQMGF